MNIEYVLMYLSKFLHQPQAINISQYISLLPNNGTESERIQGYVSTPKHTFSHERCRQVEHKAPIFALKTFWIRTVRTAKLEIVS